MCELQLPSFVSAIAGPTGIAAGLKMQIARRLWAKSASCFRIQFSAPGQDMYLISSLQVHSKSNNVLIATPRCFDSSPRHRMIFTNASAPSTTASSADRPTHEQLQRLFVQAAVPMIGFGFIDNVVMITVFYTLQRTLAFVKQRAMIHFFSRWENL